MKSKDELEVESKKITEGLKLVRDRLIAFKRYKNSPIVVSQDGKIKELNPFKVLLDNERNKGEETQN